MLEVELTGQRCHTDIVSGRNGNEAISSAASEAFARWLHRRKASIYPRRTAVVCGGEGISFQREIPLSGRSLIIPVETQSQCVRRVVHSAYTDDEYIMITEKCAVESTCRPKTVTYPIL